MTEIGSAAAILLALVMAYAAQSKLRSHSQTTQSFSELGLPWPTFSAWFVPVAELAIAVSLLLAPGWGGVAGFALLLGFTTYLLTILKSGLSVACSCFGSTGNEPVSSLEIGRNIGLLGLAATATTTSQLHRPSLAALVLVSISLLLVLLISQLFHLYHQVGSLFRIEFAGEMTNKNNNSAGQKTDPTQDSTGLSSLSDGTL